MAEVGGRIIGKFASNLAAELSGEGTTQQAAGAAAAPAEATQVMSTAAAGTPAQAADAGTGAEANGVAGPPADQAKLPIEELNLPVRSFNSLRREGVHTIGGLTARTEKELLAIDGLGPQSIKEIKAKLADRGLALTTPGVPAKGAAADTPGAAAAGPSAASTGTTSAGTTATGPTSTDTTSAGITATGTGPTSTDTTGTGPAATGTGGPRPAAVSPGARTGAWDAGAPAADRSAANGLLPPRGARPQDEDALDLLSVAGLPLLKRFAPVLGALIFAGVLLRIVRRRRRAARG
jgi:hypothetical protein